MHASLASLCQGLPTLLLIQGRAAASPGTASSTSLSLLSVLNRSSFLTACGAPAELR